MHVHAIRQLGSYSEISGTVTPSEVELLLSGPLPILNQIEGNRALVRVWVEVVGLAGGDQAAELTPTIVAPSGVQAQLVPRSVLVKPGNGG